MDYDTSAYLVQISANTAAGNGVLSIQVIVPLPGINFDCLIKINLVIYQYQQSTSCYYRYIFF